MPAIATRFNPLETKPTPAATPTPTPAPAAPAPAGGLKKVSFGGITKKKEDTKTAYPVYNDAQASEIAARIIERQIEYDILDGALKTDKADLKVLTSPFFFTTNQGKMEVPSSVSVPSPKGEALVCYQNRYSEMTDEAPIAALGIDTSKYFRQSFVLKVEGDLIPADHAQDLLLELQALFNKYNAGDALSVKEGIKPNKDFHARRHLDLTPAQNLALDQVCPIIAMIKTKGRK